jgi:hypothetical protein
MVHEENAMLYFESKEEYKEILTDIARKNEIPPVDYPSILLAGNKPDVYSKTTVDVYGGGPAELSNDKELNTPFAPESVIKHSNQKSDENEEDKIAADLLREDARDIKDSLE